MNRRVVSNRDWSYDKEKLSIRAFRSAGVLKKEIREIIAQRRKRDWDFCGLATCGAIISLCFRRRIDMNPWAGDCCASIPSA